MYGLLDCSDNRGMVPVQETGKVHRFEQEIQEMNRRLEVAMTRLYKPLSK